MKSFATSVSIIISAAVSAQMFNDVTVNASFVSGSLTVLGAVYTFGASQPVKVITRQDLLLDLDDTEEDKATRSRV